MRENVLTQVAKSGVLRVAINTGNRALVQQNDGQLTGVSPALAQRLADEIGLPLEAVVYSGAGRVFADALNNVWDVAFLAVDAARAEKVSFTSPYLTIEATYAVRASSDLNNISDVDQAGVSVLTASGSAYDMYLTETLQRAQLERHGTPFESFEAFKSGRCDAVAGVRASLEAKFSDDPAIRVLPGALTSVHQAMVLPGPDNPHILALNSFVERAISDGFIADHL